MLNVYQHFIEWLIRNSQFAVCINTIMYMQGPSEDQTSIGYTYMQKSNGRLLQSTWNMSDTWITMGILAGVSVFFQLEGNNNEESTLHLDQFNLHLHRNTNKAVDCVWQISSCTA